MMKLGKSNMGRNRDRSLLDFPGLGSCAQIILEKSLRGREVTAQPFDVCRRSGVMQCAMDLTPAGRLAVY